MTDSKFKIGDVVQTRHGGTRHVIVELLAHSVTLGKLGSGRPHKVDMDSFANDWVKVGETAIRGCCAERLG